MKTFICFLGSIFLHTAVLAIVLIYQSCPYDPSVSPIEVTLQTIETPQKSMPLKKKALKNHPLQTIKKSLISSVAAKNISDSDQQAAPSIPEDQKQTPRWHPNNKLPPYPLSCRKKGQQGSVSLALTVNGQGKVIDAKIVQSSGFNLLDQVSINSLRNWCFSPSPSKILRNSQTITITFNFRLTNSGGEVLAS